MITCAGTDGRKAKGPKDDVRQTASFPESRARQSHYRHALCTKGQGRRF